VLYLKWGAYELKFVNVKWLFQGSYGRLKGFYGRLNGIMAISIVLYRPTSLLLRCIHLLTVSSVCGRFKLCLEIIDTRWQINSIGLKEIKIAVQFRQLYCFLFNSITNHTKRGISVAASGKAFDY